MCRVALTLLDFKSSKLLSQKAWPSEGPILEMPSYGGYSLDNLKSILEILVLARDDQEFNSCLLS